MKFSVVLTQDPFASQSGVTALRFCQAVLARGHQIQRVFLFQQSVYQANQLSSVEFGECDLAMEWSQLALQHQIDMVVCATSALKKGIIDTQEANKRGQVANLASGFTLGGLGQYVDSLYSSDRVVTF